MAEMKLIVDGAVMADILRSPSGMVGRFLAERATVVQMAAKQQAPRRTGCLQDSIIKRFATDGAELAVRIVSDTSPCSPEHKSYSLFVHNGTAEHDIPGAFGYPPPFGIGGRFGGRFHPGTKANPFLSDNLHLAFL